MCNQLDRRNTLNGDLVLVGSVEPFCSLSISVDARGILCRPYSVFRHMAAQARVVGGEICSPLAIQANESSIIGEHVPVGTGIYAVYVTADVALAQYSALIRCRDCHGR